MSLKARKSPGGLNCSVVRIGRSGVRELDKSTKESEAKRSLVLASKPEFSFSFSFLSRNAHDQGQ
jgi:hypothetical protein